MRKKKKVVALLLLGCLVAGETAPGHALANDAEVLTPSDLAKNILECVCEPEPILEITTAEGTARFSYDGEKSRTVKMWNENTTSYYYQNDRLVLEVWGDKTISYFYEYSEEAGEERYAGFIYDGDTYYYGYNENGRIDYILDSEDNYICSYEYNDSVIPEVYRCENDVFVVDTNENFVGNVNPVRYYGWYYDMETEHYYLGGGIYYNARAQLYVSNLYSVDEEKLASFCGSMGRSSMPEIVRQIIEHYTYLMGLASFGAQAYSVVSQAEWNNGKRWYDGVDQTEVVARCIYAENTGEDLKDERIAVAVAIANRVLYKSQDTSPYGAVTRISQFASVNPGSYAASVSDTANARKAFDKSKAYYQEAILLAATLDFTTNRDEIDLVCTVPAYITTQTEFLKLNTVYTDNLFGISNGQWYYYTSWGTQAIKDVAVAGKALFQNPTGTMEDNLGDYYRKGHNIFFNYGTE